MTDGGELEAKLVAAIKDMVEAGVRPEDMQIEFHGMRWKWCPIIKRWTNIA